MLRHLAKYQITSIVFAIWIALSATASTKTCKTTLYNQYLQSKSNNLLEKNDDAIDLSILPDTICIPIVVHNLYHLPNQKIKVQAIKSQIENLNKDFNAANANLAIVDPNFESLIANIGIRFFLADIDETGNSFNGIIYRPTEVDTFKLNQNATLGQPYVDSKPWNPNKYINLWVANLEAGVSGYAAYPGTSSKEDGIVIHYQNFGLDAAWVSPPYHMGKTLTHELGHYFGLKHLYGEHLNDCKEDDGLADTPQTDKSYTGCPELGKNLNTCNDTYSKQDMVQNFMNQCNDTCIAMFTKDQKAQMLYHLMKHRSGLINSNCSSNNVSSGIKGSIQFKHKPLLICNESPSTISINICNEGELPIYQVELETNLSEPVLIDMNINVNSCVAYDMNFPASAESIPTTLKIWLNKINNYLQNPDLQNNSDTTFWRVLEPQNFPFSEDFEDDPNWLCYNSEKSQLTWQYNNEIDVSSVDKGCYTVQKANTSVSGFQINTLMLPYLALNDLEINNNQFINTCINFSYAYTILEESNEVDGMLLEYAPACKPQQFEIIWQKWGKDLVTSAISYAHNFEPNETEWLSINEQVQLPNDEDGWLFRISYASNGSNPVYLDNISLSICDNLPLNIQNYLLQHQLGIFPNPSLDGFFHFYSAYPKNKKIQVELYNVQGHYLNGFNFNRHYQLDLSNYTNGYYLVKLQYEGHILSKKLILSK